MRGIKRTLFLFVLLCASPSFAQTDKNYLSPEDSIAMCAKQSSQLDIIDVWWKIIKKPIVEKCEPSKQAWKLHPSVLPAVGYASVTGFAAVVAANLGFYTDNGIAEKLSAIDASIAYS